MNRKELAQGIVNYLEFYREMGISDLRADKSKAAFEPAPRTPRLSNPVARPPGADSQTRPVLFEPAATLFDEKRTVDETLDQVRSDLGDCRRCKLAAGRKHIVFGSGSPAADLMFVGEAPGAEEDEQGLPFVGRAGQLLTRIIEAIGMQRDDVYICNILKCRPPGNRNPESDEITACEPFLLRQIAAVKPEVVCALGAIGAQALLRTKEQISRLRGQLIEYRGIKLMATYHPAYLLRNPGAKRKVWEDVQKVRDYLRSLRR